MMSPCRTSDALWDMNRQSSFLTRASRLHLVFLTFFALLARPEASPAQAPEYISFQGQIVDESGEPLTGYHTMRVRIYNSTGAVVYDESGSGTTTDGLFNFHIGPLDDVVFDGPMQIGVEIDGAGELPREDIEAAPFALGLRGLRSIHSTYQDWSGLNLVGGHPDNVVGENATGATIGGGGLRNPSNQPVANSIEGGVGSTIGGGYGNEIRDGGAVTVGGGYRNIASAENVTIAGGHLNKASAFSATVAGGAQNMAAGRYSAVPGGTFNRAGGDYSFAAGSAARANHHGSFVWRDGSGPLTDTLYTTDENQFLIKATGGVGIGTNAPHGALSVQGDADVTGRLGVGTYLAHAALHAERDNILVGSEDTWDDVIIGEADDAILGLYSSSDGTYGSGVALAQMGGMGLLNSKWGIVRTNAEYVGGGYTSPGDLVFTYGTSENITANPIAALLHAGGDLLLHGQVYAGGIDVAESFDVVGVPALYEPGDVMTLSPVDGHRLERSGEPYSTLVAGVYATKPGVVLSEDPLDREKAGLQIPLGVLGVIPTKVCAENGPIAVGDLLVTSSRPGYAMRGSRERLSFGMVIGKAMEAWPGTGCGTIDVLVNVK